MKEEFFGFYEPTKKEVDNIWKDGIFVFDANTLLNLYRYSDSTRKDFVSALTKLNDKLFMPFQVGYEYQSNRISVIDSLENSYNKLQSSIKDTLEKNFLDLVNQFSKHPSIQIDGLKKLQAEFSQKLSEELENQKSKHPDFKSEDEILLKLTDLYKDKVGKQFDKSALEKIYLHGEKRYEQQIPPGYKDQDSKKRKGKQAIYGDLIIWNEVIQFAKEKNKDIVFITDDRKEDWWTIENGKTIRPREELIKEFHDLAKKRIIIYNADSFLFQTKERNLLRTIKEESITEIKDVRKADEYLATASDLLDNPVYQTSTDGTITSINNRTHDALKRLLLMQKFNWIVPDSFTNAAATLKDLNQYMVGFDQKTLDLAVQLQKLRLPIVEKSTADRIEDTNINNQKNNDTNES